MKNIKLFKVLLLFMACFAFVSIGNAQNKQKKQNTEKSILIRVEVDVQGNITSTDTIITYSHGLNKKVNEVIVEFEEEVSDIQGRMRKHKVEIQSNYEMEKDFFCINLSDKKEELAKIFEDLQKEIEDLEIDKEARKRIEQSLDKLQEVDWSSHYISIKEALVDAHHEAFGAGNYEVVKVAIGDGDTTEYHTTIKSENHYHDANANVIIVKSGENHNDETLTVWVTDDLEAHELEKANEAGISIDENNKLGIRNLNVEVNNNLVKIGVMTNEEGELKVLALDDDFKTLQQIKTKKLDGEYRFSFDLREFDEDIEFILFKQNGKMSLMTF